MEELRPQGTEDLLQKLEEDNRPQESPPQASRSLWPLGLPEALAILAGAIVLLAVCLLVDLLVQAIIQREPTPTPEPCLRLSAGCGGTHTVGSQLPIEVESDVGGHLFVYAFNPQDERVSVVDQVIQAGQTFSHLWVIPANEGMWKMQAGILNTDVSDQCSFIVTTGDSKEPEFDVVYDFVDMAPTATWIFYSPLEYTTTYTEASGWPYTYRLGSVRLHNQVALEDGSYAASALETHPPMVPFGEIWGKYDLRNISLQEGDRFFAKTGFLQGAYLGETIFKVHYQSTDRNAPVQAIVSQPQQYDSGEGPGVLQMDFPLPPDVGQGYFYLEVDANSKTLQDRAAWIEAQILRPKEQDSAMGH